MKHFVSIFSLSLSLAVFGAAVVAAGCSSTGGQKGDGSAGGGNGTLLLPDATGWVDKTVTGTTNIQGAWYAYGDGIGPDGMPASGDCMKKGMHPMSDCSTIATPAFGKFPNTAGKMCTTGTAAAVANLVTGTTPDYDNIWGAGIGLDLNNSGGDGGVKMPFDATGNHVTGFSFDIDMVPVAPMRIEFPTMATATTAAFWVQAMNDHFSLVKTHNEFHWANVMPPFYATTPPAFDPTGILSIQFHVVSDPSGPAMYTFCVSNLRALSD